MPAQPVLKNSVSILNLGSQELLLRYAASVKRKNAIRT